MLVLLLVFIVGCFLGLLGSGGSILLIPVLVWVGGLPAGRAVPVALAIVAMTAALGAWLHYRAGNYHARAAVLFASSGSAGAVAGSQLTHRVPPSLLMFLLGVVMLAVALSMLSPPPEASVRRSCRVRRCLGIGAAVGLATGFLGVGGGFLIVPAMVRFGGVPTAQAIGASLGVIALNSAAGFAAHLGGGLDRVEAIVPLLAAAFLGMWISASLSRRLDPVLLRRTFAILVMLVGLSVIAASAAGAL